MSWNHHGGNEGRQDVLAIEVTAHHRVSLTNEHDQCVLLYDVNEALCELIQRMAECEKADASLLPAPHESREGLDFGNQERSSVQRKALSTGGSSPPLLMVDIDTPRAPDVSDVSDVQGMFMRDRGTAELASITTPGSYYRDWCFALAS